jgi:hypothetical protein
MSSVLDPASARFHQPLLQARERPVVDFLRQQQPPQVAQVVGQYAQLEPIASAFLTDFKKMWRVQQTTGIEMTSWAWRQFNDQPWEAADSQFYGVSLGAIAVLVLRSMAVDAQGDEVLCRVVSQHAARFSVMDL